MLKHILIYLAFLMPLSAPVVAQDFDKGLAAYNTGDFATALQEWKPLAEAGVVIAQTSLGIIYYNGEGVPQDYKEAVKWHRLAAEQGHAKAQHKLGVMYAFGIVGVPQDYKEAVKWHRLAADQGHSTAQSNLGKMYDNGTGVLQDNAMAHMWYNIAAANGNEYGSINRDRIAKKMTTESIEKAQAMARECMSSGYKKCGY